LLPTFVCLPWEFGGLLGVFEREHFDVDLDFPRRIADRFAGSFATWITPLHYNKGGWESDCSRQWRLPRIFTRSRRAGAKPSCNRADEPVAGRGHGRFSNCVMME
jgi:hypothetical protein